MFATPDQKFLFRVGSRVANDYYPGTVFRVVSKYTDSNGSARYVIKDPATNGLGFKNGVRQRDLRKA